MRRFLLLFLAALTISVCAAQTNPAPREREVKSYSLPPDKVQKAIEFARTRHELYFVDAAWQMLILIAVLGWRIGPRFRDWAERISTRRIVQAYVFAPLLLLFIDGLDLPVSAYGQQLQLQYEQSVQGWGSWFWDWTKGELINFALAGLLVWMFYGTIRRSPRRWWFYFWLASIPVIVFILFLEPMVIEPLFYQFKPLQASHPELVQKLEEVVQRGGMSIPPQRMYEMNASSKTTTLNAYVAGFGASKRVVVYDTLLAKSDTAGILLVFGHEMGHYVLHHVPKELAIDCGVLLVLFYVGFLLANWILRRWGARWGVRDIADWASLPVLLLALSIVGFASDPIFNVISRHFEHEADRYGMEVIHGIVPNENEAAVQYFQMSGEVNLADPNPNPFIEFWLFDHPSRPERIAFVASYNPWAEGKSPEYVK